MNNKTEMTYSPTGGRVKIVETVSGSVTSTKQFIGGEERDGSGSVTKQFFSRGQRNGSTNLFYGKDHLGSIRTLTNDSGAVQASFNFDPYGRVTKLEGTADSDFGFAGMYSHSRSGLNLTMYRVYNPTLALWLSRDPLGETASANLYGYADQNPVAFRDPLGLDVWIEGSGGGNENFAHLSINVGDPSAPNHDYYSQSFGIWGFGSAIYKDEIRGGPIFEYAKSDPVQDAAIIAELKKELGITPGYNLFS